MAKAPKNLPNRGDRCKLRGRTAVGTLKTYNPESLWAVVDWEDTKNPQATKYVHLHELERLR